MAEKAKSGKAVSLEEAEEQVIVIAKRLALLYHYMAEVLVEKFGQDKAETLLKEVIDRYGSESGLSSRKKVEELGLPLTAENFKAGSDLPKWGWESDRVCCPDGVTRDRITYCPLAETWKEKGSATLGRIYCRVDQAKYKAYNSIECLHLKNVLDGDDCCLFDLREKKG